MTKDENIYQHDKQKIKRVHRRKKQMRKNYIKIVLVVFILVIGGFVGSKFYKEHIKELDQSKNNIIASNKEDNKADKNVTDGNIANNNVPSNKVKDDPKPNEVIPGENIIYSAKSYAVPANKVNEMILSSKPVNNEKEVFLTFDDGPSENTNKILKILKDEGVHATFFVIGSSLNGNTTNQELLKRELEEGNAIANHTYSHDYHKLYPRNNVNVDSFIEEVNETNKLMKEALGENFDTKVLRMPGGYMSRKYYRDKNLKNLDETFKKDNIVSIDWDAETGDATGKKLTVSQMVKNVEEYARTEKHMVLLMHDAAAKKTTVQALPEIIKYLKGQGYSFKVISNAKPEDKENKDTTALNNENNANTQTDVRTAE